MGVRRRPGGRSARVRQAVLQATLDEIADVGYHQLRVERVAARAGVNKTTLYRWWPTKGSLLGDAVRAGPIEEFKLPDTGSVREDLIELWRMGLPVYGTPRAIAITRALEAERDDPDVTAARSSVWAIRVEAIRQILQRGARRGEVKRGLDPELVADMVTAPVLQRVLGRDEPFELAHIRKVIDTVLNGIRPRPK
jgi:AcrR family transcriptional regulator